MMNLISALPLSLLIFILRLLLPRLSELEKENLLLRYQLLVLKRQNKRPQLKPLDRAVFATITSHMKSWANACIIIKPDTILSWHRKLVRWKWSDNKSGRPAIDQTIKALIVRMKIENRLWGAGRIHGELLKIGYEISESTVRNILNRKNFNPWNKKPRLGWWEFLKRHEKVWSIDFYQVHTALLQRLYVFVVMDIHSRELITTRVTANPTTDWVMNVLKNEFADHSPPNALVHDRDPSFRPKEFKELLISSGIRQIRTPRMAPKANAHIERLNGTLQRECTDHFLFFNERQVERVLLEYKNYYNTARCHQGLEQKTPLENHSKKPSRDLCDSNEVSSKSYLSGLHHAYFLKAG